jgi:hypothetical protein
MPLTFIETNKLPKKASAGQGEVTEVLNEALCKARNVHGSLRWLKSAETFKPDVTAKHQLIYLMDGKGNIRLNNKDYNVEVPASISDPPRRRQSKRRAGRR